MYPQITILAQDMPQFVIELRLTADPQSWEVFYHGNSKKDAISIITKLMKQHQSAFIVADDGCPIKGYVFQIRRPDGCERFFKTEEEVTNPFYNRKVYANINKESIVSFHAVGFE
jgi:hypothetical protein